MVLSNNMWCKWSRPAFRRDRLFFKRIILTDKNSKTKIDIDHASKIGCAKFLLAIYIKMNETINPINKLPPSPKNILGSLKTEKLKHKNILIGIIIIIKKLIILI